MPVCLQLVCTVIGLLLVLAGTGCAWMALYRTYVEHGEGPLWPALLRVVQRVRRYLRRRRPRVVNLEAGTITTVPGSVTVAVSGPEIDLKLPIDEQVRLLVRRVTNIERQATGDRTRFANDLERISARVAGQAAELRTTDQQLRALARSIAVSPVKLQICGLLLVGIGTVLMAAPTVVSLWTAAI